MSNKLVSSKLIRQKIIGRPRSITEANVRKLVKLFKDGHTVATACRVSGIPRSTYYDELARNEEFSDRVQAAQDLMTWRSTQIVNHSLHGHNLETAKWWLDRQDRLAYNAQRVKEYRDVRRVILTETETYQHSRSIEVDTA